MNSKMTRIRTVLCYLTLGPMIAFGLLSILASGGGGDTVEFRGCLAGIGPDCPARQPPPPRPPPRIDLSLAKTASNPTPPVGNAVVFTLTLRNAAGLSNASGVVVTDALPVGYRYVSDNRGAATAVAGNTVTWTAGSIVQGSGASLDITATVMPGGAPYVNDAEVTAANETDLDSTPGDATGDDFAMVGTTPTGVRAYVSSQFDEAVSVIDPATNTVVDTITLPLGTLGRFSPHGVAVHPHGTRVCVVNASSPASNVSVIDTATNRVTNIFGLGANALTIAVLPDGSKAYVPSKSDNTLSVIDTATNTVTNTIAVGNEPFSVAVHPADTAVYTADEGLILCSPGCVTFPASVLVIDPATNTVVTTIPVPLATIGIAVHPDGSKVYASRDSNPGEVAVIDTATNTVTTTITVGNGTRSLAVHPDGSRVYTTNGGDGTVSVIDTTTNTVIATVTVTAAVSSNDPFGVAVHPDGNTVYVTNIDDDTVTVIDTATNTEVATIPVGDGPWSVGQFIWRP